MGLRILGFFLQRTNSAGLGVVSTAWGSRMGEGVASSLSPTPGLYLWGWFILSSP